mmetsp:Transcript_16412/g.29110  ORF Transcript_16412/g.29110 Transcript_16412/m.29110 type:complete len:238 (-) Transcript_16412:1608-2321(-)
MAGRATGHVAERYLCAALFLTPRGDTVGSAFMALLATACPLRSSLSPRPEGPADWLPASAASELFVRGRSKGVGAVVVDLRKAEARSNTGFGNDWRCHPGAVPERRRGRLRSHVSFRRLTLTGNAVNFPPASTASFRSALKLLSSRSSSSKYTSEACKPGPVLLERSRERRLWGLGGDWSVGALCRLLWGGRAGGDWMRSSNALEACRLLPKRGLQGLLRCDVPPDLADLGDTGAPA